MNTEKENNMTLGRVIAFGLLACLLYGEIGRAHV